MKKSTFTRKKFSLVLTVLALAALFALAGCAAQNNDEVLQKLDGMQAQMDEMDARINELHGADDQQNADDQSADQGSNDATSQEGQKNQGATQDSSKAAGTELSTQSSAADFEAKLSELDKQVTDAVATAEDVSVPKNAADRPGAYYDAVAPLEKLDAQLDKFDDTLEAAYRNGSVTKDEFWKLEKAESKLEDMLDKAEESLEFRMGVDD